MKKEVKEELKQEEQPAQAEEIQIPEPAEQTVPAEEQAPAEEVQPEPQPETPVEVPVETPVETPAETSLDEEIIPPVGETIQEAASSLLNGMWKFINILFDLVAVGIKNFSDAAKFALEETTPLIMKAQTASLPGAVDAAWDFIKYPFELINK